MRVKMKKVLKVVLTFLFVIATYNVVSKAAISATSKTVNSGETFSISVTSNVSVSAYTVKATGYSGLTFVTSSGGTGAGTTTISDAKATGGMTSLATFQFKAPDVEKDQTFKVDFSASGMGDVNLAPVADSSCTATITVKAKTQNSGENGSNTSQTGGSTTTPSKSNVATLSNLGITPNDFKGFSSNKLSYSTEVPNDVETVEIYAKKGQSRQTISGTDKKTLKEGANTFNIVVTAEDGTTKKTYTLTINRKAKETSATQNETSNEITDNTTVDEPEEIEDPAKAGFGLTKLEISGFELQPQFQTDVFEYNVDLKENLDKLEIETVATQENATVEITGNENLQDGENIITILVNSEDGQESVAYQIIVNKTVEKQEVMPKSVGNDKIKKISILSGAVGIIVIIALVIVVKKIKSSKNEAFIPYENIFDKDDEEFEENNSEIDNNEKYFEKENFEEDKVVEQSQDSDNLDMYEEEKIKYKKRSKGKRFK